MVYTGAEMSTRRVVSAISDFEVLKTLVNGCGINKFKWTAFGAFLNDVKQVGERAYVFLGKYV